ncbi:hypothetical protein HYQ46_000728 [Verticillium longisporum]|nr:hypothetical protein HYQ46_000728 [Verticillium longisporum]
MSGRVIKRSSVKTDQRKALAALIDSEGEIKMPCTGCFKRHLVCKTAPGSSRCGECVRRGRSCDGVSVVSALEKALAEQKKREAEIEDAEMELEVLQTKLATALGRLSRLRKMRKAAKIRGEELFARGIRQLDEEDGVLPLCGDNLSLEAQEANVVQDLQEWGASGVVDWSSLGFGEEFSDLGPVPDDGTLEATAGSSGS